MTRWQWGTAAASSWVLAAIQGLLLSPWQLRLAEDYAEETSFAAVSRLRPTMMAPWEQTTVTARRVDQTLVATGRHNIVQGSLHWTTGTGEPAFETASIYGVDRYTRANVPGYGDADRSGQFLFPLHTAPRNYFWWDPQFLHGREAVFEYAETADGMELLVFRFQVTGIDESDGYAHLPDVPERYRALTDGKGRLWVEPVSGTIVRYEEEGRSYFYEAATKRRIGDFHVWDDRFTPQAQAARVALARQARLRVRVLESYLPMALTVAGALALALALRRTGSTTGTGRKPESGTAEALS